MKKLCEGLYEFNCELDLVKLNSSCMTLHEKIKDLQLDPHWYNNGIRIMYDNGLAIPKAGQPFAPNTTKTNSQYNVFTFILPQIHELYNTVKQSFYAAETDYYGKNLSCNYYMQSWLNVYDRSQYIDWHSHTYNVARGWHGFFCVNTEPSSTHFKFFNGTEIVVPSINNKLVIGLSESNSHKSSPWEDETRNRITIAFDIIPELGLKNASPNHWIPI